MGRTDDEREDGAIFTVFFQDHVLLRFSFSFVFFIELFIMINMQNKGKKSRKRKKKPSKVKDMDVEGFTVIGPVKPTQDTSVDLGLPEWISHPITFDRNICAVSPVSSLDGLLSDELLETLTGNGIEYLFPVQSALIPYLTRSLKYSCSIRPRDVCVSAPTGSGKTLAYVLPLINLLKDRLECKLRALVVCPVETLALQVKKVFDSYAKNTPLKIDVSKKTSFPSTTDIDATKPRVDIFVCTPGRLVSLIRSKSIDLKHLEVLVMDEADRLMAEGSSDRLWLQDLERAVYGETHYNYERGCPCASSSEDIVVGNRIPFAFGSGCSSMNYHSKTKAINKWLFSATVSHDPVILENIHLYLPILFSAVLTESLQENETPMIPVGLTQKVVYVDEDKKPLIVWYMLQILGYKRVLCFTRSLENTHRLYLMLKHVPGVEVAEFSSSISAKERASTLKKFIDGKIDVLVTSDMMARGLDLENVQYVISYDIPANETGYIHRVGRTARAGKQGVAVSLVVKPWIKGYQAMVRKAYKWQGRPFTDLVQETVINEAALESLMPKYEAALQNLETEVQGEVKRDRHKRKVVTKS